MLVEQFLHIMLNQEYPRFFVCAFFSTAKIYIFALRYIMGNGKYEKKVIQTFAKPSLYKIRLCKTNPQAYVITKKTVINKSVLKLNSVAGGGFAISILAQ